MKKRSVVEEKNQIVQHRTLGAFNIIAWTLTGSGAKALTVRSAGSEEAISRTFLLEFFHEHAELNRLFDSGYEASVLKARLASKTVAAKVDRPKNLLKLAKLESEMYFERHDDDPQELAAD
ncbi:MAG TPA: hypothetical protein VGD60_11485 [Candidatus Acidoferrales bacterium]